MGDDDDEPISLPSWLDNLQPLATAGGGVIATLIAFGEGPREFIVGEVLGHLVEQILAGGAYLVEQVDRALAPLVGLPETIVTPILSAGGTAADAIVSVLELLNAVAISVAASAGPAAPFVPLVLALLAGIALSWLARLLIRVIPVL